MHSRYRCNPMYPSHRTSPLSVIPRCIHLDEIGQPPPLTIYRCTIRNSVFLIVPKSAVHNH